jgi:serine/threonine protein kinase
MNERQIFEGAIEFRSPADRRAFLDKACGGDVALRSSVEALLAAHDAASQFLNVPAVEQLQGGSEKGLDRTLDHSVAKPNDEMDIDDGTDGPDLSFLQPANKPGSIGSLGHYEILQILGQGAFGVVFRAFDEKLHRQVAVKAMNPQLAATSPPRKRFLREARSVAAIKHENIVQIYSVEEQPLPYLVMEFVQGQTLQQKLDGNGPLDVPEILHLGRQMAAGLAAAHALNMIHRDVKPGNILLEQGAEQKVKITDFGLARAADDASITRTGVIAGTPMYMSPE